MVLTRRSYEDDLSQPADVVERGPAASDPDEPAGATAESPRTRRFGRRPRPAHRPLPTTSRWYVPAAALGVVSVMLIGFCLQIALIGNVTYQRSQQIALADFRYDLARATAPVGQSFTPQPEIQAQAIAGEKEVTLVAPVPLLNAFGTPVAAMSIPALGMRDTVVLEGTSPSVTQDGPGHERNSVLPGQEGWSLIYGRAWSYGGPFGDIATLKAGDRIRMVTGQGKHIYAVTGVRRPGDPLPQRQQGQGRLVLGTADGKAFTPDGVVYVDAVLTSAVTPTPPRRVLDLEPSEKLMAGDSSAWFTILLWTQGLMIAVLALAWARTAWGRSQAWIVGVPVLAAMGIGTANSLALLLPNVF
jgi:sortase A